MGADTQSGIMIAASVHPIAPAKSRADSPYAIALDIF